MDGHFEANKFLDNQLIKEKTFPMMQIFSTIYFDFVEKKEDDCCQNISEIK